MRFNLRIMLGALSVGVLVTIPKVHAAGPFSSTSKRPSGSEPNIAAPQSQNAAPRAGTSNQEVVELLVGALRRAGLPTDGIGISSQNGMVTLSGTVTTEYQRERAERVARSVRGVSRVNNRLQTTEIAGQPSPQSARPLGIQQANGSRPSGREPMKVAAPTPPSPQQRSLATKGIAAPVADDASNIDRRITAPPVAGGSRRDQSFETEIPRQIPRTPPVHASNQAYTDARSRGMPQASSAPGPNARQFPQNAPRGIPAAPQHRPVAPMPPPAYAMSMNPAAGPYGMAPAMPSEVPQIPRKNAAPVMRASHAMPPTVLSSGQPIPTSHDGGDIMLTGGQSSASAWPHTGSFHPFPQIPLGWRKSQLEWDDGYWQMNFRPRTERWWWYLDHRNWHSSTRTID